MDMTRRLIVSAVCAVACSQAQALMSINVFQDDTSVPGWVVNTFTVDSDTDLTAAVALTRLNSGSLLQVPGFFGDKRSNGLGDSYISINNDELTIAGLGAGDLGSQAAIFDSTGISQTWLNTSTSDIGTGMHLATLTFSEDTSGNLEFIIAAASGFYTKIGYGLTDGIATEGEVVKYEPKPDPNPLPDPGDDDPGENPGGDPGDNPGGNPGGNPGSGGNPSGGGSPIPEPAGLGLIALVAVAIGGLHRRRLVDTGA